jgi:4-hydroxythreonine-4-phosphate dehydrogenase
MRKIVVTMGDPAGIGPEVTVRALVRLTKEFHGRVLVVGEAAWLRRTARVLEENGGGLDFVEVGQSEIGRDFADTSDRWTVPVYNPRVEALPELDPGFDYAVFGAASFSYVKAGVDLVRRGEGRSLVTAPISKHAWHLAGFDYPGHTELLAELDGSPEVGMMFWGERLKVLLLTTHLPLVRVPGVLSEELVVAKVSLLERFLSRIGRPGGLAMAALNPHAGEQGAFGDEEKRILEPALARLRHSGVEIVGPVPADVLFHQAFEGRYQAVVALYHDQGLVPFKMIHFRDGVNLSLGLSFIRTSVDHGTAFDIAGRLIADSRSLEAALRLADNLSPV